MNTFVPILIMAALLALAMIWVVPPIHRSVDAKRQTHRETVAATAAKTEVRNTYIRENPEDFLAWSLEQHRVDERTAQNATALAQAELTTAERSQHKLKMGFPHHRLPDAKVQGTMLFLSYAWVVVALGAAALDFSVTVVLTNGALLPAIAITIGIILTSTGLSLGMSLAVRHLRKQAHRQVLITAIIGIVIGLGLLMALLWSMGATRAQATYDDEIAAADTLYQESMSTSDVYIALKDAAAHDRAALQQGKDDNLDDVSLQMLSDASAASTDAFTDYTDRQLAAHDATVWALDTDFPVAKAKWQAAAVGMGLLEFCFALTIPTTLLLSRHSKAVQAAAAAKRALMRAQHDQQIIQDRWLQETSDALRRAGVTQVMFQVWLADHAQRPSPLPASQATTAIGADASDAEMDDADGLVTVLDLNEA